MRNENSGIDQQHGHEWITMPFQHPNGDPTNGENTGQANRSHDSEPRCPCSTPHREDDAPAPRRRDEVTGKIIPDFCDPVTPRRLSTTVSPPFYLSVHTNRVPSSLDGRIALLGCRFTEWCPSSRCHGISFPPCISSTSIQLTPIPVSRICNPKEYRLTFTPTYGQ